MPKILSSLLQRLEDYALIFLISSLLLISLSQIALRNLGLGGLPWADEAMRMVVLWLAFFGAMRSSRLQNHIAIDLFAHYQNIRIKRLLHFLVSIFCAAICGIAAFYCWRFIVIEYDGGQNSFLGIPAWFLESVIPFGLGLIALRFFIQSIHMPEHHDPHHFS